MMTKDETRDAIKDAYLQKMEAQFEEWDADVRKLKAKAHKAQAGAKIDYYRQMEALDARLEATRRRLQDLRGGSGEAWADLKAGLKRAVDELGRSLHRAFSRLG